MTDRWAELDPSLQAYAQAGNGISREALLGALIERGELGAAVNAFFEQHDLLICPVYPHVAPSLAEVNSSNALFPHFTAWCHQLSLPAASLYAGLTASRLPIGIQIAGGRHADALVLWASHMLERAFGSAPFAELARVLSMPTTAADMTSARCASSSCPRASEPPSSHSERTRYARRSSSESSTSFCCSAA
ncbi:hypothetical protein LA345_32430 [Burkholderia vietnamiensis]|nr:hypothetical protein [Burkholderia vietnamiensis]